MSASSTARNPSTPYAQSRLRERFLNCSELIDATYAQSRLRERFLNILTPPATSARWFDFFWWPAARATRVIPCSLGVNGRRESPQRAITHTVSPKAASETSSHKSVATLLAKS